MNLLVTGGTGTLGRHVAWAADNAGYAVRIQSRKRRPASVGQEAWVMSDLATGEGVAEAVAGIDVVVHAASDPRRPEVVDVGGTKRLVEAARAAGVRHLVYVSIVGVDRIPLRYYRAKAEAEQFLAGSGIPHSILRATQFHEFLDHVLGSAARFPFALPLPTRFRIQSVAAEEVAGRLVGTLAAGPAGRLPDFGGPEVMTLGEAAEAWKAARRVAKTVLPLPMPGRVATALRAGENTAPNGESGAIRWQDWLEGSARQ